MKKLEEYVKSIPDFPEPGIIFRDITTILQDPDGLHLAVDGLLKTLEGVDYDVVVGPESRGNVRHEVRAQTVTAIKVHARVRFIFSSCPSCG